MKIRSTGTGLEVGFVADGAYPEKPGYRGRFATRTKRVLGPATSCGAVDERSGLAALYHRNSRCPNATGPENRPTQLDLPFYSRMDYGHRIVFWRMLDAQQAKDGPAVAINVRGGHKFILVPYTGQKRSRQSLQSLSYDEITTPKRADRFVGWRKYGRKGEGTAGHSGWHVGLFLGRNFLSREAVARSGKAKPHTPMGVA